MKTNPRKPLIAAASALLLACSPCSWAGTVLLDPGHGGPDAGITVEGHKESEIMLSFAKVFEAELKKKGYTTVLSRDGDQLAKREYVQVLAEQNKAQVVIGLHLTESKDPADRGIRIFRCPEADAKGLLPEERELPDRIAKALGEMEPKQQVTVKRLGKAYREIPKAILIELGYLSNAEDRKLILSPEYQEKLAQVLARVINDLY